MADESNSLDPILCAPLLRKVDGALIDLLGSLPPAEWDLQTIAPQWKVRDVAAHLLDTPLRKLSLVRDRWFVESVEFRSPQDLIDLVNRLNREGVAVYRRLSPVMLIDMMKLACRQSADFHESLDPFAPAAFNVSWAGEETSINWFDTARELTERWHHQQQIRLATNRPGLMTPEFYHPVLDCFLRGLPHLFRDVEASAGTTIQVEVAGDCGGQWLVSKSPTEWTMVKSPVGVIASRATIPQSLAWRLFTRGIHRDAARTEVNIEGNKVLGEKVLALTAIVA
jgi:uncharacterized protein (TIGR03083 family)